MPATLFYTRRFISGINTYVFMCAAYTKIETATMHIRCAEYMHAQYSIHTAYISATFMHILGMYTAYLRAHLHIHMYAARVLHTKYIHIACMVHTQKLAQRRTHAIQQMKKYMQFVCNRLHAACMLHINNCMYAAHKQLHVCCT